MVLRAAENQWGLLPSDHTLLTLTITVPRTQPPMVAPPGPQKPRRVGRLRYKRDLLRHLKEEDSVRLNQLVEEKIRRVGERFTQKILTKILHSAAEATLGATHQEIPRHLWISSDTMLLCRDQRDQRAAGMSAEERRPLHKPCNQRIREEKE